MKFRPLYLALLAIAALDTAARQAASGTYREFQSRSYTAKATSCAQRGMK